MVVPERMLGEEMRRDEQQQQQQQAGSGYKTPMNTSRERRPLRSKYAGRNVARKYQRAAVRQAEYRRLKAIIPTVAERKSVSKVGYTREYWLARCKI